MAAAQVAAAQALPELRLDAGYARVRQRALDPAEPDLATDAALIALFWRRPTERWEFLTSANLTYTRDSLAAAQGVAAFAVPWIGSEHLRTDIGAAGATFSLRSAGRGGNGNLFARQHYVRDQWGTWLGAAAAISSRDGTRSRAFAGDVGAWTRWRFLYGSASYSRSGSTDWPLLITSGATVSPYAIGYELDDAQLVLEARNGPHQLGVSWVTRRVVAGGDLSESALSASATLQMTDRVAVLLGAGKQLFDPLRGLPEADLATAALRISLGPRTLPVMQRSALSQATVMRLAGGGGRLEVRVFASDTVPVEVAGDFSDWKPLRLEREGSFWVARAELPRGKYHVGVRLRQGSWRAPRNLARVRDDYGGESGLVVIP